MSLDELLQDALSRRCISVPRKAIDHVLWPETLNGRSDAKINADWTNLECLQASGSVSPNTMRDSGATGLLEREMVKVENLSHKVAALEKTNQQQQEEIELLKQRLEECQSQRDSAFNDLRGSNSPTKGLADELVASYLPRLTFDVYSVMSSGLDVACNF